VTWFEILVLIYVGASSCVMWLLNDYTRRVADRLIKVENILLILHPELREAQATEGDA
jgi:hypothetical protein